MSKFEKLMLAHTQYQSSLLQMIALYAVEAGKHCDEMIIELSNTTTEFNRRLALLDATKDN